MENTATERERGREIARGREKWDDSRNLFKWVILNGRVKCIAWFQCICNVNVSSEMASFAAAVAIIVVIVVIFGVH